jgi:hypothetical protein
LHNRGKSVAHKIQIQPLDLHVGRVAFKEIDNLDVGSRIDVLPELPGSGLFRYDMFNFLYREANKVGAGDAKEFPVKMSATYQSVSGKRHFRVTFDLIYSPYNKMMLETHPGLSTVKSICEVKNTKIVVEKVL